ncbi:MAG TPA: aminoacyl-histidine dipeptidase [Bacteroidales bacterium]|nr:aminoacyl-histidine dipeptidase [Bacteroidales bacterium]
MSQLGEIRPGKVWSYFEEICKIPRLSKNEEKIRKYLLVFAAEHNLKSREDSVGNILITRDAGQGMEKVKTVVLQSHLDMVGGKNASHSHDWKEDPIIPVLDGKWVGARGTTLGADDGIGIAAQMAILTDPYLKCGKIECLFTVDEESGMTGAINLSPDFFTGRILLNLDSEDEGILFIGCAGGIDTQAMLTYTPEPVAEGDKAMNISVTGLHGGHSGDEIHKGYGNAIKIISRLLQELERKYSISVCNFTGGNLRNAIPREAFVTITFNPSHEESILENTSVFNTVIREEFGRLEPDLKIIATPAEVPLKKIDPLTQHRILNALSVVPHGVIGWSKDMPDLVETSSNLATVSLDENNVIHVVTTQRSSSEEAKHYAAMTTEACFELAGAKVTHSDGYPGWKPNMNSAILRLFVDSYRKLFGKVPQVKAIHAGLECGLILEKYKGIDMISFGPTIRGAHTPEEKIEIETVQMFWDLLVDVLKHVPEE